MRDIYQKSCDWCTKPSYAVFIDGKPPYEQKILCESCSELKKDDGFFLPLCLLRYLDRQRRKGNNAIIADSVGELADQIIGDELIKDSLR